MSIPKVSINRRVSKIQIAYENLIKAMIERALQDAIVDVDSLSPKHAGRARNNKAKAITYLLKHCKDDCDIVCINYSKIKSFLEDGEYI